LTDSCSILLDRGSKIGKGKVKADEDAGGLRTDLASVL